jgi:hypothetical protein
MRSWERGRRTPDTAARNYLHAIDAELAGVQAALRRHPRQQDLRSKIYMARPLPQPNKSADPIISRE